MAVPKRRVSKARQGLRRSHLNIKAKQVAYCSRCGEPVMPHFVCDNCGWSNTQKREVVKVATEEE